MGKPEPSEADERLKMVKTQLADTQPIGSGTLFSNLRHLELTKDLKYFKELKIRNRSNLTNWPILSHFGNLESSQKYEKVRIQVNNFLKLF